MTQAANMVIMTGQRSGRTMAQKIEMLRHLLEDVEVATGAELAGRWGVSREAVRQMFDHDDAPSPLLEVGSVSVWAVAEAERYRSLRLQRAGNRGGRHA